MKPVLARWLLLWLRARRLPQFADDEVLEFLAKGSLSNQSILSKLGRLTDGHVKVLNLSHDWLECYLPFVLQKVSRVHFGLLQPADVAQLVADGVKIPSSRKLTAVPFVAKDVPSRASEFAHPDVLIGLTILAYRYEGLRNRDFYILMQTLRDSLEEESGPYPKRPSCKTFELWVMAAGKNVRGSKKKGNFFQRESMKSSVNSLSSKNINIFDEIFSENDDLIWPLQLVDPKDKEQFKVLFPLMSKLPHAVMHYLNELIFPEVLAYQVNFIYFVSIDNCVKKM